MKNRACIYRTFGRPSVLEVTQEWPYPALDDDLVIVRVTAVSINPKDTLLRKGLFKLMARTPLPRATALDAAGEVVEVGRKVHDIKPGDAVFGMTNRFSGGLLCDFIALPATELALAPETLALEQSAAIPLAALTALQALKNCSNAHAGKRILIVGASGGVGHFAVQIASIMGASVDAACSADNREFVISLGAQKVWDYRDCTLSEIDAQYDIVFDVSGRYSRTYFSRQLSRKGVYISTVPNAASILGEALARLRLSRRSRLVIVRSKRSDLEQLRSWVDQKRLTPQVSHIYTIEQTDEAHRQIETGHTRGKVVVTTGAKKSE